MKILVINSGSSSIKYRLFDMRDQQELARGLIERIGEANSEISHESGGKKTRISEPMPDYQAGIKAALRLLSSGNDAPLASVDEIEGVGHRVLHGGEEFIESVVIDAKVIDAIERYSDLGPLHNPPNLAGIRAAMQALPGRPNVAVFDTAFFQTLPPAAYIYPLPYEWYENYRVRRYGFHGTSHRYITLTAADLLANPEPNLITIHLGNGCSVTCVKNGKAIDQSMGLTPLEGLCMGTRCGDIDPAIIFHMARKGMSFEQIHQHLEKKSGLHGISGVSRDMRDVCNAAEAGNERAVLALDVFVHRVRRYLGAFLAELGHCDAVVFTGGIGEGARNIRSRVLDGLAPLGIELDAKRNDQPCKGPFRISTETSRTAAWVIPTNEELMIARDTHALVTGGHV